MDSTVALKFRSSVSELNMCRFSCPWSLSTLVTTTCSTFTVWVTVSDREMPLKCVRRGCLASVQMHLPVIPKGLAIRRFGVTDEKEFLEKAIWRRGTLLWLTIWGWNPSWQERYSDRSEGSWSHCTCSQDAEREMKAGIQLVFSCLSGPEPQPMLGCHPHLILPTMSNLNTFPVPPRHLSPHWLYVLSS